MYAALLTEFIGASVEDLVVNGGPVSEAIETEERAKETSTLSASHLSRPSTYAEGRSTTHGAPAAASAVPSVPQDTALQAPRPAWKSRKVPDIPLQVIFPSPDPEITFGYERLEAHPTLREAMQRKYKEIFPENRYDRPGGSAYVPTRTMRLAAQPMVARTPILVARTYSPVIASLMGANSASGICGRTKRLKVLCIHCPRN